MIESGGEPHRSPGRGAAAEQAPDATGRLDRLNRDAHPGDTHSQNFALRKPGQRAKTPARERSARRQACRADRASRKPAAGISKAFVCRFWRDSGSSPPLRTAITPPCSRGSWAAGQSRTAANRTAKEPGLLGPARAGFSNLGLPQHSRCCPLRCTVQRCDRAMKHAAGGSKRVSNLKFSNRLNDQENSRSSSCAESPTALGTYDESLQYIVVLSIFTVPG